MNSYLQLGPMSDKLLNNQLDLYITLDKGKKKPKIIEDDPIEDDSEAENNYDYDKAVDIYKCEFEDEQKENQEQTDQKLDFRDRVLEKINSKAHVTEKNKESNQCETDDLNNLQNTFTYDQQDIVSQDEIIDNQTFEASPLNSYEIDCLKNRLKIVKEHILHDAFEKLSPDQSFQLYSVLNDDLISKLINSVKISLSS